MAFYNRFLATQVAKFVNLQGDVEPLETFPVGGAAFVDLTVASNAEPQILVAPSPGFAYRLQRFVCFDNIGATGGVALINPVTGTSFYGATGPTCPVDNLHGLVTTSAVSVFNGISSSPSARVSLWFDLIRLPVIS